MAYDPALAERVRTLLDGRRGVTEKAMFGGLAFLLGGRMFCGVLGGELLARVGPDGHDAAMARPGVRIMDFTGRPMRGYVFAGGAAIATAKALRGWVEQCAAHAATLPDKPRKKPRPRPKRPARKAPAARRRA